VEGEDFYSVEQAARILKLTPGRIRQMLRAGELEGVPPGEAESGGRGWSWWCWSSSSMQQLDSEPAKRPRWE